MRSESNRVKQALVYAMKKHEGQFRIGGDAYITHPIAVAEMLEEKGLDEDYIITALFHDLLEDTDATEEEIESIGGCNVLTAVRLLTKKKDFRMDEYIIGIRSNAMAFTVKCADRLHNLRSAVCADEAFKKRYVLESMDWYWDFCSEIPTAVKALAQSMETQLTDFPFLYELTEENEMMGSTHD